MMNFNAYLNRNRYRIIDTKSLQNNQVGVLAYESPIPNQTDDRPHIILCVKKVQTEYFISNYGQHYSEREEAYRKFNQLE